jgi:beta-N-acetylhexosaminidase
MVTVMRSALITGLAGPTLTEAERQFLRSVRPAGIILFARNCLDADQIRRLVAEARTAVGEDHTLVLIDQEGGRVQRLRPPLGRTLPPAIAYGRMFEEMPERAREVAYLVARLLAEDLRALGIDTDCAPVLDVPVPGAHDIIGDRAYGRRPEVVAALGRAVAEGLMAGGVLPVVKHVPGHGRATQDSHLALPVVATRHTELSTTDFAPFRALDAMPAAMTAHVVFSDIDPDRPASTSPRVIAEVIRGEIGFDGLLMSDDLGMKALTGGMRARAEAVIAAGSDVALHCSGDLAEMAAAAAGVPSLAGPALRRFEAAIGVVNRRPEPFDRTAAEVALEAVLADHARHVESV